MIPRLVVAQDAPYQAMVAQDGATVHSGPGESFYGTSELAQGDLVNVYRHDPNDWVAIQPTDDSFSMVPSEAIEMIDDETGRCRHDETQVWVGTRLGPVENPMWQVKLKAGEEVTVLGEINYPTEAGFSVTWYQIAPPAGEYRWIKGSQLLRPDKRTERPEQQEIAAEDSSVDKALRSLSQSVSDSNLSDDASDVHSIPVGVEVAEPSTTKQVSYLQENSVQSKREIELVQGTMVIDDPFATERSAVQSGNPENLGWRKARSAIALPENSNRDLAEPMTSPRHSPARLMQEQTFGTASSVSNQLPSTMEDLGGVERIAAQDAVVAPTFGADTLSDRLRRLEVSIASEIIKPAEMWNLEGFAQQLIEIQSTAQTDDERRQAQVLVGKLDRLRETHQTLLRSSAVGGSRGLRNGSNAVGTGVDSSVKNGTTYDAYGWLNVLTRDSGRVSPSYVLQDDDGKIIFHIEPIPGIDLSPYLHKKIGVIGERGFNQTLKLKHVNVERVVVLDRGDRTIR
ncbi:MAG: hypothetical protein R3C03_07595 [Pirellulaceae bacterium]